MRKWKQRQTRRNQLQIIRKMCIWHAKQQRTMAQTLGRPSSDDTGEHVLQKTRQSKNHVPLNRAMQATRLEQSLVQTLRRYRDKWTDPHEQRSQCSDSQNRTSNRPQNSTNKRPPRKTAQKQRRSDDNRLDWNEHTINTYQTPNTPVSKQHWKNQTTSSQNT